MKKINIIVVDDHKLVRAGLKALLQTFRFTGQVAEASHGLEALSLMKQGHYDIVLIDITLPGMDGFETATRMIKKYPASRIIITSIFVGEEYVRRALRSGAMGFLSKDAAVTELEKALKSVMQGQIYLHRDISSHLKKQIQSQMEKKKASDTVRPLIDKLTVRQREILRLIAEGQNTKEIAYTLKISIKTVESHRMNLMDRLKIHDIPGLVRYAVKSGLISLDI